MSRSTSAPNETGPVDVLINHGFEVKPFAEISDADEVEESATLARRPEWWEMICRSSFDELRANGFQTEAA